MARFERICPECGASNSFQQTNCVKCRAPLVGQTAAPPTAPEIFSRRGIARLTWRATKFLTRAGVQLAWRGAQGGLARVRERAKTDVKNETIDGEYQISEWRVWSKKPEPDKTERAQPLRWGTKK